MLLIGVTGGVGTGKSSVSEIFRKLGAIVLDADRITHQLLKPGTPVFQKIRKTFGKQVLSTAGRIDHARLGKIVFQNPRRLKQLTGIIHPAVRVQIRRRLEKIRRRHPHARVVLNVPLLIEAGSAYSVDAVVVVSAPLSKVTRRLIQRSGWSRSEILRRSRFQMPLREKEKQADFVVKNGGSLVSTRRQVVHIWKQLSKEKN